VGLVAPAARSATVGSRRSGSSIQGAVKPIYPRKHVMPPPAARIQRTHTAQQRDLRRVLSGVVQPVTASRSGPPKLLAALPYVRRAVQDSGVSGCSPSKTFHERKGPPTLQDGAAVNGGLFCTGQSTWRNTPRTRGRRPWSGRWPTRKIAHEVKRLNTARAGGIMARCSGGGINPRRRLLTTALGKVSLKFWGLPDRRAGAAVRVRRSFTRPVAAKRSAQVPSSVRVSFFLSSAAGRGKRIEAPDRPGMTDCAICHSRSRTNSWSPIANGRCQCLTAGLSADLCGRSLPEIIPAPARRRPFARPAGRAADALHGPASGHGLFALGSDAKRCRGCFTAAASSRSGCVVCVDQRVTAVTPWVGAAKFSAIRCIKNGAGHYSITSFGEGANRPLARCARARSANQQARQHRGPGPKPRRAIAPTFCGWSSDVQGRKGRTVSKDQFDTDSRPASAAAALARANKLFLVTQRGPAHRFAVVAIRISRSVSRSG